MRILTVSVLLVGALLGNLSYAGFTPQSPGDDPVPRPDLVVMVPDNVFVPYGFDNNDNSQVIIEGEFPNTCYRVGPTEVAVDEEKKRITITNQAYFYNGCFCEFVLVPWTKTVDLGIRSAGDYQIFVRTRTPKDALRGTLNVAVAKQTADSYGPDDHLYAPVSDAYMESNQNGAPFHLILRGRFMDSCLKLKEVKVIHDTARAPNVVVVLPIAERIEGDCLPDTKPFETKVAVDHPDLKGKVLLHVRTLNGNSLNQVIDFDRR